MPLISKPQVPLTPHADRCREAECENWHARFAFSVAVLQE